MKPAVPGPGAPPGQRADDRSGAGASTDATACAADFPRATAPRDGADASPRPAQTADRPLPAPVPVLVGPTASGKTAIALALARELPLEIVSVDSALVYRGLDIGTAKPGHEERAAVPHHLIDILDPTEAYSAARFAADARRCIAEIRARGRVPLLVGGTLLYLRALTGALDPMPAADPAVRAELDRRAAALGWPALHAELAIVDPATAARLAPRDAQRIQRALEIWLLTGRPLSDWQRGPVALGAHDPGACDRAPQASAHRDSAASEPALKLTLVSLEPLQRAWLHARIAERFDAMLAAGLLDEVECLRRRADLHPDLPALRSVGYRQAWAALDAGALDGLREAGIAATRQLAKRQLTGLRALPAREIVAADSPDAAHQALARLRALCEPWL
jgi:tRNA dimethylallyltransferase